MARTLAISYSDVISSFWLSFASPPNFAEDRRLVLWGFPFLHRSLPVLPRFDANLCLKSVGCFPPISTSGDGFAFKELWSNNGESGRHLEQHSKLAFYSFRHCIGRSCLWSFVDCSSILFADPNDECEFRFSSFDREMMTNVSPCWTDWSNITPLDHVDVLGINHISSNYHLKWLSKKKRNAEKKLLWWSGHDMLV